MAPVQGVFVGMTQDDFLKAYPRREARTFRREGTSEWWTYNHPREDLPVGEVPDGTITFQIENGKVSAWTMNDREESVREYLSEFCSADSGKIYEAIRHVLTRLPPEDFLYVTDRRRPVLFTGYYDRGTARFATSSEIYVPPEDPPSFQYGFTLIKLSEALKAARTPSPIEGIIAHELAHRVLEHVLKGNVSCDSEREANALIKKWGFESELKDASKFFGRRRGEPKSCQEKK